MTFLLPLLGIGKTVLGFLKAIPWQVYAIVAGVVLVLIAYGHWHKAVWNAGYDVGWSQQHRVVLQEQAARRIDEQSIATLEAALAASNAEKIARAKAFDDSKAQDAKDVAGADARAKADAGRQARLQGIADHAAANPTCAAPKAILDDLEGL